MVRLGRRQSPSGVILVAKFADGAWVTILLVAALMAIFLGVRRHYHDVAKQLVTDEPLDPTGHRRIPQLQGQRI